MNLPKVSVVIVNYNYGRFLEGALTSVLEQTYPNVEIVIVDDKSTDNSGALIDDVTTRYPEVLAVKSTRNVGQSAASLLGMNASSGPYIIFLDADDQLLPTCVEAHIYAHLSSRLAVAFTSVDVVNRVSDQDVSFSHAGFAEYVVSGIGRKPCQLRPVHEVMPGSWFEQRTPCVRIDDLHFIPPPHADPWVWSPTSANCYRRDAVQLLLRDPGMEDLRWGTDTLLIRPLSALFGSVLIDRPLAKYVSHHGNYFSRGAPLQNTLFYNVESEMRDTMAVTRFAIKRLMSEVGRDGLQYNNTALFFDAMRALCVSWPAIPPEGRGKSFYLEQLRANRAALVAAFSAAAVDYEHKR